MLFQAEDQGEREERLLLKRHDQRINRGHFFLLNPVIPGSLSP
jgi:hypothetical protein